MKKCLHDCLNCANSLSLPAGEPFTDGSIETEYDRLVCCVDDDNPKIVNETDFCINYN